MKLRVDFGDEQTGEWKSAAVLEPNQAASHGASSSTWNAQVSFPSGETLQVGAVYAYANRSLNIVVSQGDTQLFSVFGFKLKETTLDPSMLFLSPGGLRVQVAVGI